MSSSHRATQPFEAATRRVRRGWIVLLLLAAAIGTIWGWDLFFFSTDDAYIAFRYVSNAMLDRGYVWNPPPFRPVEGYSSFLWIVILEWTWRLTGVQPPVSSNYLSLGLGYGTLLLVAWMILRMSLPASLERFRLLFLAAVFVGTLTNRSFLAWLSSGLETALFNFCVTFWICFALLPRARRGASWIFFLSLAATLTALTRPEGVLMVMATPVILVFDWIDQASGPRRSALALLESFPLLGSPLHFLWRRWMYGEWLPNTYYAKVGESWPESGVRYLLSFVLEYSLWIWVAVLVVCLVRLALAARPTLFGLVRSHYHIIISVSVLSFQVLYYTFAVGGDHFEYRIYSCLVPLIFVSFVWAVSRLRVSPGAVMGLLAVMLVAEQPIPWVHFLETRHLNTREETWVMFRPIAYRFPVPLRQYVRLFDSLQEWLIIHHVCTRHQEHKVFHEYQLRTFPSRELGELVGRDRLYVIWRGTIGVPGWIFPNLAILDVGGLADHTIARTTPIHEAGPGREHRNPLLESKRLMAHDRIPPPGYLECFADGAPAPPLDRTAEKSDPVPPIPITEERVRYCESLDWP